jgi:hypothetical protein
MRDTLKVFGARLGELAALWRDEVAARISAERKASNTVEEIRQLCSSCLGELFRSRQPG